MQILLNILLFFSLITPATLMPVGEVKISEWKRPVNSPGLAKVVRQELTGTNGDYYIYIRHLPTGESYAQNQNVVMQSGSLYKSWLAIGVLTDIKKGKLHFGDTLEAPIKELNEWAGLTKDTAELTSGTARYTVFQALTQMIVVSHNYSAFLLTREVGNPLVQKILREHGLFATRFERPPQTSAADMALFLEKVYRGRFFTDFETSQKLRDLLAANELNDGIPKLLPRATRVEHKTGEIGKYKHDCGIVYSKAGDYIICVMTKTNDPIRARARTADISLAVYNYFQNGN